MTKITNIRTGGAGGPPRTPTDEVLDSANRVIVETDAQGRQIGVRRVTVSHRRRIYKALTPDSQARDQYVGMVMLAAACASIDGEDITLPATELRFDALIDRLDDDGMEVIGKVYREHFRPQGGVEEEAKN